MYWVFCPFRCILWLACQFLHQSPSQGTVCLYRNLLCLCGPVLPLLLLVLVGIPTLFELALLVISCFLFFLCNNLFCKFFGFVPFSNFKLVCFCLTVCQWWYLLGPFSIYIYVYFPLCKEGTPWNHSFPLPTSNCVRTESRNEGTS